MAQGLRVVRAADVAAAHGVRVLGGRDAPRRVAARPAARPGLRRRSPRARGCTRRAGAPVSIRRHCQSRRGRQRRGQLRDHRAPAARGTGACARCAARHCASASRARVAALRRRFRRDSARAPRDQRIARTEFGRHDGERRAIARGPAAGSPHSRSRAPHSARNRRLTPGSLKRLAMVGNTGTSASASFTLIGMIAAPLLAHVAQRILRAALFELVEHDHVGEIEHVDFLELARGAVLGRHHVQREVGDIDDLRVALPDARRLDDDEIEARGAIQRDDVGQHRAGREVLPARRERTHEYIAAPPASSCGCDRPAARRPSGAAWDRRRPPRSGDPGTGAGNAAAVRRSASSCPRRPCR